MMPPGSTPPPAPVPAPPPSRSLARAEQVARAVLYEGYILYPYRPSSVKNRQRWSFGGVYPQAYSAAQGGTDAWTMHTECLIADGAGARIDVRVRFLQIQDRIVAALDPPLADLPPADRPAGRAVPRLQVGDEVFQSWQEGVEREIALLDLGLPDLLLHPHTQAWAVPASQQIEPLRAPQGPIRGLIRREQRALAGTIAVAATPAGAGLVRLAVHIENHTPWQPPAAPPPSDVFGWEREDAILHAFVSTHTLLEVRAGAFVSLLDPPAPYQASAAACRNTGTWPVLVGDEGAQDLLLSSPIILYDYPEIAPESPGDLFDGTEIDEILTLRILTMTDAEKQEMRQSDPRARALLERTEALPPAQLQQLHGALRTLGPREGRV